MTAPSLARRVLTAGGMRGNAIRIAAVLARSDLEQLVDAAIDAHEAGLTKANQRSKLIYLRVVDPYAGSLADTAYAGLSELCHQHAYELSPTAAQVSHLLGLVDDFADLLSHDDDAGPGTTRRTANLPHSGRATDD